MSYDDYDPAMHRGFKDVLYGTHPGAPVRLTDVQDLHSPAMAWIDEAPCSEVDPEIFFPGQGEHAKAEKAKAICARCPFRQECLEYALATPQADDWGIWGGTAESERRIIRRQRARGLAA